MLALHGNVIERITWHYLIGIIYIIETIESDKTSSFQFRLAKDNTRDEPAHGRD